MQKPSLDACTQCGTVRVGPYCHTCGQLHSGKKAGLILLVRESLGTFFSLERSGMATLWQLLKNPGFVISNYLNGNRGYHQPPNKLLFYALVVYGLHVTLFDTNVLNLTLDIEGTTPSLFFMLLVIPFLSLGGWLLYNPKKHGFADHLVVNSYFVSVWFILLTVVGDTVDYFHTRNWDYTDFFIFMLATTIYNARYFKPADPFYQKTVYALIQIVLYFLILATIAGIIYLLGGRVSQTTL